MRITIICPESLMDAANHAMVLLNKAGALNTYTEASWQDGQGNLYAVSSGIWRDTQISGIQNPAILADPDVAVSLIANGGIVDPLKAGQAKSALSAWDGEGDVPQAAPGVILALPSADAATAQAQIAAAGLVPA